MRTEFSEFRSFMAKHGNKMTEQDLVKEQQKAFDKKVAKENELIEAYDKKKLKSKDAIAKAKAIKARRNRPAKDKKN